jgi:hypothetical protein
VRGVLCGRGVYCPTTLYHDIILKDTHESTTVYGPWMMRLEVAGPRRPMISAMISDFGSSPSRAASSAAASTFTSAARAAA